MQQPEQSLHKRQTVVQEQRVAYSRGYTLAYGCWLSGSWACGGEDGAVACSAQMLIAPELFGQCNGQWAGWAASLC